MRILFLCGVLFAASLCPGDTIRLKNGRTIVADSVAENGNSVQYAVGDDTYTISKNLVDRIDTGGVPGVTHHDEPVPEVVMPSESVRGEDEVFGKIIRNGRVDIDALYAVEKIGSPELAAAAYFTAGKYEAEHGSRNKAREYLEQAHRYMPDSPIILNLYVSVLLQMRKAGDALPFAEEAARMSPANADAQSMLGYAYFLTDHTPKAIDAWKKSLAIRPDATIQGLLAKAQREDSAETDFSLQETGHFTFHYEGGKTPEHLRQQIITVMEAHYDELVRDLNVEPRQISVSLYSDHAYFDVTQAPAWSSALNDGKIRIPISGLTDVTPELSRVLKHELSHSFINQLTRGRCPQWLNEGVAQLMEGRSVARFGGHTLAMLYASHQQIPLNALDGSWMRFNERQAQVAYAEGLAASEYIRDTYGISDVQRILQRIGDGASTEAALRSTVHAGYGDLEEEVNQYLKGRFGN
ncbi:MAG: peptidase MA family metallohydrolase [Terriglobales bacterium]|jgi:Peptidase MA superfamily/Tetratricopeptide repeat